MTGPESRKAEWYVLRAEADLQEWNYDPAIRALGESQALSPSNTLQAVITIDQATAFFERAQSTGHVADYGTASELLSKVLENDSGNQVAIFNRAILYEHLDLFSQASADWQHYLQIDSHGEWSPEARQHLDDVQRKLESKGKGAAALQLPGPAELVALEPARMSEELDGRAETYQHILLTNWLPTYLDGTSNRNAGRASYSAAMTWLSRVTADSHGDSFFIDLLRSVKVGQPSALSAAADLSKAIIANQTGDEQTALGLARRAEIEFLKTGNEPGALRARFEQAYAWQFSFDPDRCLEAVRDVVVASHRRGYRWLEAQGLIQQAFCANMEGRLQEARVRLQSASKVAEEANYEESFERALVGEAAIEWQAGSSAVAWSRAIEGLDRYWSHPVSAIRGISFYDLLDLIAEETRQWRLQQAVLQEAIPLVDRQRDPLISAQTRYRLACSELMLKDGRAVERDLADAMRLFRASPQTDATTAQETVVQISLAKAEMLEGQTNNSLQRLNSIQPRIGSLKDSLSSLDFYTTLGEVYRLLGRSTDAENANLDAIRIFRRGLGSLADARGRLTWYHEGSSAYRSLVQLKVSRKEYPGALKIWESYRRSVSGDSPEYRFAEPSVAKVEAPRQSKDSREHAIALIYAKLPDGMFAWLQSGEEVRGAWLKQKPDISVLKTMFVDRCSDPSSNIAEIKDLGHRLYDDLLRPFATEIAADDTIVIEPDEELAQIPFAALVDDSGEYIGTTHDIAVSPVGHSKLLRHRFSSRDSALLIVADDPVNGSAGDPVAVNEARSIASLFDDPVILGSGSDAHDFPKLLNNAVVFHYAGHSDSTVDGTGLLLAREKEAGRMQVRIRAEDINSRMLKRCRLVVLSACITDRGEDGIWFNRENLALAFLNEGVPEVVASAWEVDSEASTKLMECFYSRLLRGISVPEALRLATNELRTLPGRAHPYYWAGFSALQRS
jgi:CHAT domain-containing protein